MTYESAIRELKEIIDDLRNELVSVDELTAKVKRAKELIEFCKNKLREVEDDLEGLF